jgi:hypothetical protein
VSWGIAVTRHSGFSSFMPRVRFDTETRMMKKSGTVQAFENKDDADAVCQHYRHQHSKDEHAICRKSYKVIKLEGDYSYAFGIATVSGRHGTG